MSCTEGAETYSMFILTVGNVRITVLRNSRPSVMSRIDSVTVGNDMSCLHVMLSFQTKKEDEEA